MTRKNGILAGVFFGGLAFTGANIFLSRKWLRIKHETAEFRGLPENLDGLRILHISDLHSHSESVLQHDIWSSLVRERTEFDIVVITGDLMLDNVKQLKPHLKYFKLLASAMPVLYVDGNHEVFFYDEIKALLQSVGVIVLDNESRRVKVENFGDVNIIGLRDYYYLKLKRFAGIKQLFESNSGAFNIILSHQPQIFDKIKPFDLGLVLAGHTHGGQVRLPFCPTLFAPGQGTLPKYGDGWYASGNNIMYISRGVGTTVFPVRFFNRPEIAVITLKAIDAIAPGRYNMPE